MHTLKHHQGFNTGLAIVMIAVVALVGFYFLKPAPGSPETQEPAGEDNSGVLREACPEDRPACPEGEPLFCRHGKWTCGGEGQPIRMLSFAGNVLAGTISKLLDFNQTDFQTALNSDQLIVLYFYANWCPICRAEIPEMYEAFNALTSDQVIGFRVNYNDNDTDAAEKKLAQEQGVLYQHTKVFLKNGERLLYSPETWEKERYLEEINTALK